MCVRHTFSMAYLWKVVLIIDLHFAALSEADFFCFWCSKFCPPQLHTVMKMMKEGILKDFLYSSKFTFLSQLLEDQKGLIWGKVVEIWRKD